MRFIQNKKILLLSFVIAFILWYYIKLGGVTRQEMLLPIRISGMPKNMMIVGDLPQHLKVLMESDGRTLMALQYFSDIHYEVDLTDYKAFSKIIIYPQIQHIHTPVKWNPKIMDILEPDSLVIIAEEKIKKRVPIRPDIRVNPEPGFVLVGGVHLSPDSIAVTCPASLRDSVNFVPTRNAEIRKINRDYFFSVGLIPPSNRLISYPDKEIQVSLNVQPLGEISINHVPVRLINAPPNHNLIVQPSTFSIRIRGGVQFLAGLSRDSIYGYIDYENEQKLKRNEPAMIIRIPSDVTWTQITPNRFKVVDLDEN